MAQWVKNPTAATEGAAKTQVQSLDQWSGLKDPVLPQLWCRSQLWLGFSIWPRNFHMLRVLPLKKKKKSKLATIVRYVMSYDDSGR